MATLLGGARWDNEDEYYTDEELTTLDDDYVREEYKDEDE